VETKAIALFCFWFHLKHRRGNIPVEHQQSFLLFGYEVPRE